MLEDLARMAIIESSPKSVFARRTSIRLDSTPLRDGEISFCNPEQYNTTGQYTLKYNADNTAYRAAAKKPFVFNCDIYDGHRLRMESYEQLEEIAKTDARTKWILENTNISKDLFRIAKSHPDMPIPFCFDVARYEKRLKKIDGKLKKDFLWEVDNNDA